MVQADLWSIISQTQKHIAKNYAGLLTDENKHKDLRSYIEKFIQDQRASVKGFTEEALIDRIYSEMAEYSVLTEYLRDPKLNEININSWDDIKLTYAGGTVRKATEHFKDPSHAVDIVKRLLHHSGMIIDNAAPMAQGHLPGNIRVTALKTPIVDDDCGISVSIRIIHLQSIFRQDLLDSGMASEEMISFLEYCIRYGVSVVIAGKTFSGKTTLTNVLLSDFPNEKRIFSIESGARELAFVKRDGAGEVINNVVHTLSRPSDHDTYNITQEELVVAALRFNPDLIVIGEIRDAEANAAVEASLTGHTVVTTVHSGPAEEAHTRIALLCQRRFRLGMDVSLMQARQAFPIIAFCHLCEDNVRRVMNISEVSVASNGEASYRCLYRYHISENVYENGICHVNGYFEQVEKPSEHLQSLLMRAGIPQHILDRFTKGGAVH